ncbi:hypothetical protein B8V81_3528 [Paenibacillus pasadenensis]|uniref:Uncharacterized protein n=1 Tax=Paenibacillus pasadenensis TaxID=217090 RepID=A0A2N5N427_9BACL|nr:hypothetical protein B8V81_3528 [Paenibacillus pasadenensis]
MLRYPFLSSSGIPPVKTRLQPRSKLALAGNNYQIMAI